MNGWFVPSVGIPMLPAIVFHGDQDRNVDPLVGETFARSEQLDKAGVMLGDAGEANRKVVDSCADLILRRCQRNLPT